MSPSREGGGETKWSECSVRVLENLQPKCLQDAPGLDAEAFDHEVFEGLPGKHINADRQVYDDGQPEKRANKVFKES